MLAKHHFIVKSLESWKEYEARLVKAGYRIFSTQNDYDGGYNISLWAHDKPVVEFKTYDAEMGKAMFAYPLRTSID